MLNRGFTPAVITCKIRDLNKTIPGFVFTPGGQRL